VVLENGQVRLSGTGKEVLNNPEIGALYLGGTIKAGPETPPDVTMEETD
jgi:ABC-type lipopolysaccharide export system ATPase subunit